MAAANVKVRQPYLKFDSIVIGPGAKALDAGWFNSWIEFAAASKLQWFVNRNGSIPSWASSDGDDRTDWPYEVHQFGIEFFAPIADFNFNALPSDNWMPRIWTQVFPFMSSFRLQLAQTDVVLKLPGVHAPAAVGATGPVFDNSPSGVFFPAQNGQLHVSNSWKFPDPVKVALRSTCKLEAQLEFPLNSMLPNVAGPGPQLMPNNAAGGLVGLGNYYIVRAWLRGARFIENIGARG